ncbi:MAG TPA: amidohydrolase family protein, partial [Clostridiales bacterium]|nr:amidohydrolase family protein [Clostridiales bacterium]
TGYHITVSGGHGTFLPYHVGRHRLEEMAGMYADGADEWRKLARLNIWNRVDNLKVVASWGFMDGIKNMHARYAQATVEELSAAIREAHAVEKRVLSHANGNEAVKNSIEAGADVITHGFFLTDMKLLEQMAEKGIYWEPTNAAARTMFWAATDTFPKEYTDRHENKLEKEPLQIGKENWEYRLKNFSKMVSETGVKVIMGSDAGCSWLDHGLNAVEIEACVEAGLSTKEALLGATKYSAEALGISDTVGTVEAGKCADLVVVDGNPLDNVSILLQEDKIKMVYRDGELVIER